MKLPHTALLALLLFTVACGGRESMASKSAAAYRDAQAKGIEVGGDGHGHHDQGAPATTTEAHTAHETMDHTAHGTTEQAVMDHAQHEAPDHAAHRPDHAAHDTATHAAPHDQHAGMQHTAAQHTAAQHTTTQHAADPHAGHTMTTAPPTAPPAAPAPAPRSNAEIQRIQPGSTLRPDAFDAPVPVSVSEAAKTTKASPGHGKHH